MNFDESLKFYFKNRKRKKYKKSFIRGFNWYFNSIMFEEEEPAYLNSLIGTNPFDDLECIFFDRGASAAREFLEKRILSAEDEYTIVFTKEGINTFEKLQSWLKF